MASNDAGKLGAISIRMTTVCGIGVMCFRGKSDFHILYTTSPVDRLDFDGYSFFNTVTRVIPIEVARKFWEYLCDRGWIPYEKEGPIMDDEGNIYEIDGTGECRCQKVEN